MALHPAVLVDLLDREVHHARRRLGSRAGDLRRKGDDVLMTLARSDGTWTLRLDGSRYDAGPFDVGLVDDKGRLLPPPRVDSGIRPQRPFQSEGALGLCQRYSCLLLTRKSLRGALGCESVQPALGHTSRPSIAGGRTMKGLSMASGPLALPARVIEEARIFFEDRVACGLEGTAMIKTGADTQLVVPSQRPRRDPWGGVNVEVPREGQMELVRALGVGELYVARIHSHPGDGFHSAADDDNPVITFTGAISIVVPLFGLGLRRGLDACAVYRHLDGRWVELAAGAARDRWVVVEQAS